MTAIIEEGSPETGQKMQLLALAEGAVPIHLLTALFTKSTDNRLLMQRQLSRHLIALWTSGNEEAGELLKRNCEAGRSVRLLYDTDAEDMYFQRSSSPELTPATSIPRETRREVRATWLAGATTRSPSRG